MRARPDANHGAIREACRGIGAAWVDTHGDPTIGFDAVVGYRGLLLAVEIKDGQQPPSRQRLTPNELARQADFERVGVTYHIWRSVAEAIACLEELT